MLFSHQEHCHSDTTSRPWRRRAEMPIDEGVLMATVQLGFTEEYAR